MIQEALAQHLPIISHAVLRGLVIFVIALGIVYIMGRMLELINSNRGKNALAVITMLCLSLWSLYLYDLELLVNTDPVLRNLEILWRVMIYSSLGSIFFVIFGWDLFDRANAWLDKTFAPDPNKQKRVRRGKN